MRVGYSKRFLKQLARLSPETRTNIERFVFDELPHAASIAEVGRIERMRGYRGFYKARFGSYRVGMKIDQGALILEVVMDRKDIYKCFP